MAAAYTVVLDVSDGEDEWGWRKGQGSNCFHSLSLFLYNIIKTRGTVTIQYINFNKPQMGSKDFLTKT